MRPGMYIGKLVTAHLRMMESMLVKEVMDNSIGEFVMGNGKKIEDSINNDLVEIRDYGEVFLLGK